MSAANYLSAFHRATSKLRSVAHRVSVRVKVIANCVLHPGIGCSSLLLMVMLRLRVVSFEVGEHDKDRSGRRKPSHCD